ncbi:bifunctional diguanylate cyclase/phosphodiesterase [Algiphilus sp.]|uniref:bifunctional diguanylate cyclase/phosphodiesterase n=1 Tax=Algiphilus sp. TaxID=1872431 RepID=UPI0025C08283|nr:PAS domain S-box protein [Algiphilus sp.]MCK5769940.1 PAS domain S-box protein [Algiphilus sp.]
MHESRRESENALATLERVTRSGTWILWPEQPPRLWWSAGTRALLDWPDDAPLPAVEAALAQYTERCRPVIAAAVEAAIANDGGWELDLELVSAAGVTRWVHTTGEPVVEDGRVVRVVGTIQDIDARRVAEERAAALAARNADLEQRWKLATEGSGLGVWDWDASTNKVYFSARWKTMLGYAEDEIANDFTEWDRRLHPDDKERAYEILNAHLRGESEAYRNEIRMRCKNGRYKWILTRGQVVERAPDGTPLRVVGTHSDIDRRKYLEDVAGQADARFRGMFDSAHQFIGLLEPDGTLLEANRTALDFAGVGPDVVRGTPFWDCPWWPRDAATQERLREAVVRARRGETVQYQAAIQGPDGRSAIIDFSLKPLRDDSGEVSLLVPEGHDITRLIEAQRALDERERLFSASFDHSPIGAAIVSLEGEWQQVNQALCAILGYSETELRRLTFQDITHPDDLDADLDNVQALIEGRGQHYRMDKRYIHAGGGVVHAQLDVTIIRDPDGLPLYFMSQIQDVTERHRMRDAILREKELAQVTLASIADGVVRADKWGRVSYINEQALRLLRLVTGDILQRPFDENVQLVSEIDGEPLRSPIRGVLQDGMPGVIPADAALLLRDRTRLPIEGAATPIRDDRQQLIGSVFVFRDVSDTRRLSRQLLYQASHDPLTGLPNRREFEGELESLRLQARARGGAHQLLMLDLDHFKAVNDRCGHQRGDQVLVEVATVMQQRLRASDILARIGGDEFALILRNCTESNARQIGAGLIRAVNHIAVMLGDERLPLGLSVGMTPVTGECSGSELMHRADAACYRSKQGGRNRLASGPDEAVREPPAAIAP